MKHFSCMLLLVLLGVTALHAQTTHIDEIAIDTRTTFHQQLMDACMIPTSRETT